MDQKHEEIRETAGTGEPVEAEPERTEAPAPSAEEAPAPGAGEATAPPPADAEPTPRAAVSAEERILGGIAHLALFFNFIGFLVSLIMYLIYRRRSRFVSSHAKQAVGLAVIAFLLSLILGTVAGFSALAVFMGSATAAGVGAALTTVSVLLLVLGGIAWFILVILGAVKGFLGEEHHHPLFGRWLARLGEEGR